VSRPSVLLLAVLFVGLGARLWGLEFQSLWWDEGVSVYLSGAGARAMTIGKDFSVDLHPPGYHLMLAIWRELLGPSVFADRLLSVFAGVMTVALSYAFTGLVVRGWDDHLVAPKGRGVGDLGSWRVAPILAALLAAVSTIDVHYSQETRMYAFLPSIGLLSLIATIWVTRDARRRVWVAWILVNLFGLYVYYYLALLTVAESLCLLLAAAGMLSRVKSRPRWSTWIRANLALVLGYTPWFAVLARRALGTSLALPPEAATHPSPSAFLLDLGRSLTLGFGLPPGGYLLLIFWAIVTVGGVLIVARRNPAAAVLLLLSGFIAIAGSGAILLVRPFFYPRFVLFVVGPLWAVAAIGLSSVHPSWLVSGLLVVPMVVGNGWTWLAERSAARTGYSTSDYRVVFDSLASMVQPGDVIVDGYPWGAGYAEAYLWRKEPRAAYVPRGSEKTTIDMLSGSANRVWVFTYDPAERFASDPLEAAAKSGRQTMAIDQFGDSRFHLFSASDSIPASPDSSIATFDSEIELADATVNADAALRPGDSVGVTLRWRAIRKPTDDDTVFVHLVGSDGALWGQRDAPPLGGGFPTRSWSPGTVVVDRPVIPLAAGAPVGQYHVEVGLYNPVTGRRLTVGPRSMPDNRVVIGTFEVRSD
jgi:hypothetical protein